MHSNKLAQQIMKITNGAIEAVEDTARETVGFPDYPQRDWNSKDKEEQFVSLFGAQPKVIAGLWELIKNDVNDGILLKHLLWALIFLKIYAPNEEAHCAMVGWPTKQLF